MKKNRFTRFLKRNCINIPFYLAVFGLMGWASNLDRTLGPQQDFKIPAGCYAVWAEEPEEENVPTVQEMIVAACEDYGIDHKIPIAIAKLETGHFTSRAFLEGNNVGGMSIDEVPMSFDTLEAGVDAFVSNLAENYIAEGYDTVEEIAAKYCPSNSKEWAEVVRGLM